MIKKFKIKKRGFTLIELLVVIAILGVLSSIVLAALSSARSSAAFARAKLEFRSIATAIELYTQDHDGVMPADVDRNLPPGLEVYLSGGNWPNAPWPESVYDWDNWGPSNLSYPPKEQVYQISVRFCPVGHPELCRFPNESWAAGFDINSAVYYCIQGPCRAHSSEPTNHSGYCINC
jgi:prepilin-type N-terminal cleavage/methylation domain-containing protein